MTRVQARITDGQGDADAFSLRMALPECRQGRVGISTDPWRDLAMKIERFEDLIDWTRDTHNLLARCMARCSDKHEETRAKWLLVYIADHERALAETIDKIEKHADPKALHTWIYDYLARNPVLRNQACKSYDTMTVEEISLDIFLTHNQVIDLYRSLARRAEIDGARELAEDLLRLEEHETMRLAQQVNRIHEM
ncbi:ATPase [Pseudomonas sp.]